MINRYQDFLEDKKQIGGSVMAIIKQVIKDNYALYHGDCIEVMADMPDNKIDFSIYSPPFAELYHYSSYESFFKHYDFVVYDFVVKEIYRLTKAGRCTAVHCMDVPSSNSGCDHLQDFPGDVIRQHERLGFQYIARHCIWKEPLAVRNRTMQKNLAHKTLVEDSINCGVASADYLLIFRKKGDNLVPISHPTGMDYYAGERQIPEDVMCFKNYTGNQIENRYSHWIWRQYASSFWDDIRIDNVLPYRPARDTEDEKHVHPLQLDVIDRAIQLRTNPNEIVFTPFMGVGSEVYGAVKNGRKGIGAELKESYFNQAIKNLESLKFEQNKTNGDLFAIQKQ